MTQRAPRQLGQQFRDLPLDKRVIFIHPNYKAQHLVFNDIQDNVVYVRLVGQNLDEGQLQQQVDDASLRQNGKKGLKSPKINYLVLDEGDRAVPQALIHLVRQMLDSLPSGRIIVLSRIFPDGLLDDARIRDLSSFIPADTQQMLWDYGRITDEHLLEVRAFGEGRVHLNGRSVESWDGALPRALFFYLIDRGMVTRAEIFETFWPNLSTREATNVFHVTKRKISEVLGTELTVYGSSFYHISPQIQLSYDVSLFNQLMQDSDSGDRSGDMLRQALALYRGDYLMSLKTNWVLNRRETLQQAACDALVTLGKICETSGRQEEALGRYLHAMHLKPEREDATLAAMRLYRDMGMSQEALRAYNRLVKTLRDTLNVTPSPQVQQLAAQIELQR